MFKNLSAQFSLDDRVVFLNHGSFGACPKPVFATYQNWQLQLEAQPVAFLDSNRGGLGVWMRDAREAIADEIHTDASNVVGVINATTGLNIAIRSLDLKRGDEIIVSDHEYGALKKTWDYMSLRLGIKIVVVTIPMPLTCEHAFTQALVSSFTKRTKCLFLSHITSETALLFPIENVVKQAKNLGIVSIIDGAHTPGHIALNIDALGAGYYVGNCHKWLMAPKGAAFLYVSPESQKSVDPLVISHGWTKASALGEDETGGFGNTPFIDMLQTQGTADPSAWLSVPAAIRYRQENDWDEIARYCSDLAWKTALRINEITGQAELCSREFCAPQMVSLVLPIPDPVKLKSELMDKYGIEIPVFSWQDRTIMRLSVQGYNSHGQMDYLVDTLTYILGR